MRASFVGLANSIYYFINEFEKCVIFERVTQTIKEVKDVRKKLYVLATVYDYEWNHLNFSYCKTS